MEAIVTKDEPFYRELLGLSKVPEKLHDGLVRYFVGGIPPGSFLRFVLENDCANAVKRADLDCRAALGDLLVFLINSAPWASWGSEGRVATWIQDHQDARRRA